MLDVIAIVRAVYSGLSQRKVAATHGISRNTVSLYLRKARDQGWLTLKDYGGPHCQDKKTADL